jgi:hypothetical protein
MQANPPVVFTFTHQKWSSTTFSFLTCLTRVNIKYNFSHVFTAYYYISTVSILIVCTVSKHPLTVAKLGFHKRKSVRAVVGKLIHRVQMWTNKEPKCDGFIGYGQTVTEVSLLTISKAASI